MCVLDVLFVLCSFFFLDVVCCSFVLVCVCDCGKAELVVAVEEGKNNTLG